MSSLRILIVGAGIAGPAVAVWLSRLGHNCTIIERSPTPRVTGHQVDLRMAGVEVVKRMGIMEEVKAQLVEELGTRFVDSTGKERAILGRKEPGARGRQSLSSEYEIMRADLSNILTSRMGGTEVRYGLSVDDFDDRGDGVTVTLSDGSKEEYDLLIAADGQGSRIRRKLLRDHASIVDTSRSLEIFIAYFKLPRTAADSEPVGDFYHAPGQRMISMRWHAPDQGQAYLATMAHGDEMRAVMHRPVSEQKAAFRRIFKDAGWQAERVLAAMDDADDFYAHELLQRKSNAWSHGRVVLLGDAGYCPSPITGMGTSLALIGAYVLAGELSAHPDDVLGALRAYDDTLRPLVEQVQKLTPGMPGIMVPNSSFGIKMLHKVLWLGVTLKVPAIMDMILPEEKSSWQLPGYPLMQVS